METTKHPYELLVRWDTDGRLSGAHVQWRYVTRDGGVIVTESVTKAEAVGIDQTPGYPLDDIINQTLQDAIATVNIHRAEIAALQEQNVQLVNSLNSAAERLAGIEAQHATELAAALREQPEAPSVALSRLFDS